MKITPIISDFGSALILFADVIDSSKYSATLGYIEYAKQLTKLQSLFKSLGEVYFPPLELEKRIEGYSHVDARGDEGTIFCYLPDNDPDELIFRAIQFSYELKARIELIDSDSPKAMKVGVGIHYDKVALVPTLHKFQDSKMPRSIIESLQGFNINYAKRVESCSRSGRFSKIMLSKKAASYLDGYPVVFTKQIANLKGIDPSEEIFEVKSAFFNKMPYDDAYDNSEQFIEKYRKCHIASHCDFTHEPWQKSIALSVISYLYENAASSLKTDYLKNLTDLAWMRFDEDDPLLLFTRAKICGHEKKHSQRLEYLDRLVKAYPEFVHARIKLAEACWELSKCAKERAEIVFARNIADEFLSRFDDYLSEKERSLYKKILKRKTSAKIK